MTDEKSDSKNSASKDEGVSEFMGMPLRWEPKNAFKNVWNKDDDRVFPPKYLGVGWDMNFHALAKKLGLVSSKTKSEKSED